MPPLLPLFVGVALLLVVLGVGVWLVLPRPDDENLKLHGFGQPLIVGAVVGIAFASVQQLEIRASDRRAAKRDAATARNSTRQMELATQRQQLVLEISLRQNLEGIDLHGQDLRGLYLEGKNLSDANLAGAHLTGAVLDHAVLDRANLQNADFTRASMVGTGIIDPVDTGANFSHADLTAATIRQPFEAVSAGGAPIFDDAILTGAKLLGEYGGASFRDAILMQTAIQRGSDFVAADFTGASLVDVTGRPDNMCGTTFESARFVGDFPWTLVESDLRGARVLTGSHFIDADLRGANLHGLQIGPSITIHGQTLREPPLSSSPFPAPGQVNFLTGEGVSEAGGGLVRWSFTFGSSGLRSGDEFRGAKYDHTTRGSGILRLQGASYVRPTVARPC